ncbi:MAG: FRG domain-containing protein [Thermomicrobiales bacterium]|nr:FRG domain-containing protein [Thermomicrobiales bacterium]
MRPEDEVATSWLDLQRRLFDVPLDRGVDRFRSPSIFRGVENADYTAMTTGLMRLGGDPAEKEQHLLRNFRKYAYLDVRPTDSVWYWLAVGQHHGLPTRLLDFTYSPYVALHFATARLNRMDRDGLIWCVDVDKTTRDLPPKLAGLLEEAGAHVFTESMLNRVVRTLPELDALPGEFALFLEPPSLDDRIVNQFALFALMSNPTACLDDWLYARPDAYRRIVIPAALKWEVRDKLDQANITERVLFPGLDGLSSWLKRYYYSRPAAEVRRERPGALSESEDPRASEAIAD